MEEFSVQDFFPVYPKVDEEDFNCKINTKKEFTVLNKTGKYKDRLFYHQELVRRYLNPYTGYKNILLYHEVGTGKSKAMLAVMGDYMNVPGFGKPLILVKGDAQQVNIKAEITDFSGRGAEKKKYAKIRGRNIAISRDINKYYEIDNYQSFSNKIRDRLQQRNGEEELKREYSNRVIAIDEAHNLRSVGGKKEAYQFIHKFLHLVENCVIILASATPMVDNAYEIVSIMNLILPMEEQMDVKEMRRIMSKKDSKEELFAYLEPYFRSRISFVKQSESMPKRIDVGERYVINPEITTEMKIVTHQMSEHQAAVYQETEMSQEMVDPNQLDVTVQKDENFSLTSRYALNFVFPALPDNPNPSYSDYVDEGSGVLGIVRFKDPAFAKALTDIEVMRKYSTKYAAVIQFYKENPNIVGYVYTPFVSEYGANLLGLCFQTQGYEYYSGAGPLTPHSSKKKRFAIITTKTTKDQIRNILNAVNMKENMYGDFLQLVIGSPRSGESISFLNARRMDVVGPEWHEMIQPVGRVFRATSLKYFPEEERFIQVAFHAAIYEGATEEESLRFTKDIEMYYLAELKAREINMVRDIAQVTAFDCKINAQRNRSGECYDCSETGDEDYSSYHLLYGQDLFEAIEQDMKQLLVQYFILSFEMITTLLPQYHRSSLLLGLNQMISSNEMYQNRYGILCYLRSDQDVYYLQESNSIGFSHSNSLNSVYTSTLFAKDPVDFSSFLVPLNEERARRFLKESEQYSNGQFRDAFLNLSMEIKIVLLEKALVEKTFMPLTRARTILETLRNNWFFFEDHNCVVHVLEQLNQDRVHYTANLSKLVPQEKLRVYCFAQPGWNYIIGREEIDYINAINEILERKEGEIAAEHEIYGILNTSDNLFRIKDTTKISGKNKSDGTTDKRSFARGFSCKDTSKQVLVPYMVRFNLTPPKESSKGIREMRDTIAKRLKNVNVSELTTEQIELYYNWYEAQVQDMCNTLRNYFQEIGALFIK